MEDAELLVSGRVGNKVVSCLPLRPDGSWRDRFVKCFVVCFLGNLKHFSCLRYIEDEILYAIKFI